MGRVAEFGSLACIVSARKYIITLAAVASLIGLYVAVYFGSVERVRDLDSMQVVSRSGVVPSNPRDLVEITTSGYSPAYSSFSAEFFRPVHYIDQKLVRPHFWLRTQTEKPVRVVY